MEKELHCIKRIKEGESNAEVEQSHSIKKHAWDAGDCEEILRLSSERNILLLQVEQLQKELERAKTNAAEVELLRKISQTTACNLEEISKENEYYKKKLETMRCLEKHIEELKKQAQTLTDKYKKY